MAKALAFVFLMFALFVTAFYYSNPELARQTGYEIKDKLL